MWFTFFSRWTVIVTRSTSISIRWFRCQLSRTTTNSITMARIATLIITVTPRTTLNTMAVGKPARCPNFLAILRRTSRRTSLSGLFATERQSSDIIQTTTGFGTVSQHTIIVLCARQSGSRCDCSRNRCGNG
jgi:hypothetical protein